MNRKKILIVDDSPIVLEAARIALEEAGHEVVALDNPLQLAFVVRRTGPDLVLVDVNMPAITGDVVTEIMRSNPSASRTQIVLYSDISKDELSARAGRCGAAGFIQKQADEEMFVKEVERFLRD